MKKISFILPCYNVERFIFQILNSIYSICNNSGWTEEEYEIIIVDDGSVDDTYVRACQFKETKGLCNIIIVNKDNGGVSSARNAGLDNATGEWVWFIDPDDQLSIENLNTLWAEVRKTDIDMLSFGYTLVSPNYISEIKPLVLSLQENKKFLNQKELQNEYVPYLLGYSQENIDRLYRGQSISEKDIFVEGAVWHSLFKRDIIVRNDVRFNENVILKEDALFVVDFLSNVGRVLFIAESWYRYRMNNDGGLAGNLKNAKKLVRNKIALSVERDRLAKVYKNKLGIDIRPLYIGSNVMSVAEIAVKSSYDGFSLIPLYMEYVRQKDVLYAISKIQINGAPYKYKIPFILMKCHLFATLYLLLWIVQKCGMRIFGSESLFK